MPFLLIEMPGGGELLIILVVVLLMFGGKKIPELMRGLGRGIREFNDAKSNVTRELEEGLKVPDHTTTNSTPVNMPDSPTKQTLTTNETTSHTTPSAN